MCTNCEQTHPARLLHIINAHACPNYSFASHGKLGWSALNLRSSKGHTGNSTQSPVRNHTADAISMSHCTADFSTCNDHQIASAGSSPHNTSPAVVKELLDSHVVAPANELGRYLQKHHNTVFTKAVATMLPADRKAILGNVKAGPESKRCCRSEFVSLVLVHLSKALWGTSTLWDNGIDTFISKQQVHAVCLSLELPIATNSSRASVCDSGFCNNAECATSFLPSILNRSHGQQYGHVCTCVSATRQTKHICNCTNWPQIMMGLQIGDKLVRLLAGVPLLSVNAQTLDVINRYLLSFTKVHSAWAACPA